jgi:hypothetical protein
MEISFSLPARRIEAARAIEVTGELGTVAARDFTYEQPELPPQPSVLRSARTVSLAA